MSVGTQSNAKFYSIFDGKICKSHKSPVAGSKERVNKQGNVVHELFYDFIDGVITSIRLREHKTYGKSWLVTLKDGDEMQVLQFPYSSQYSQAFLKTLPNVDLKKTIKIIPSKKQVEGKDKLTLFVTQEGTPIKHFWTKEKKGDLPDLVKVRYKGNESWDDTDQMEFFEKFVVDNILPKLGQASLKEAAPVASGPANVPAGSQTPIAGSGSEEIDDMPF